MNVSLTHQLLPASRPALAASAPSSAHASQAAPQQAKTIAPAPAQQSVHGASMVAGADAGSVSGGGGFSLGRINIGKVITFAGLGAMAAMVMPPLAPIGAMGGAIAGVILSLIA